MRRELTFPFFLAILLTLVGIGFSLSSTRVSKAAGGTRATDAKTRERLTEKKESSAATKARPESKAGAKRGQKPEQVNKPLTQSLSIASQGITVRFPEGWSVARDASGLTLLNVALEKQGTLNATALDRTAQVIFDTEDRRDHAEAVRRLKEIEAEVDSPSTFLTIGGWPALQRRFLAPKPRPVSSQGQGTPPAGGGVVMQLNITTAVAAGDLLIRLDGRLLPDAPSEIADQIEAIGRSLLFPTRTGNPGQVDQEIKKLRTSPSLRPSSSTPLAQQVSSPTAPASGLAPLSNAQTSSSQASSPQFSVPVGVGSELSVAVSPNGKNIVIGSNSGYNFSTDTGQTWNASAGLGANDPQVTWGQSGGANGTFYAANIAAPSTAISVSTNNGQTFAPATNSFTCPGMPPSCGGFGFPDQEQIAADRFSVATGGDRVYATWRNGGGSYGIVCSTNSAVSWSPAPAMLTAGDFARITVGQNGIVYVIYESGGNLMLNSYPACNGNPPPAMAPRAGFPVMVVAGISQACPVPGLDRCPTGSPEMVAVDDTDPNHIYVAYNKNTAGNEDIIVQDSPDGGLTWDTNPANHRIVKVNTALATRRFLPWVCAAGGAARVTWYDRRASTPCPTPPCAANNDLTDYFAGSAFIDGGGNLVAGTEFQVNSTGSSDAQCAAGAVPGSGASWPFGVIATGDSEQCSVQPQLAGFCCLPCPQFMGDSCVAAGDVCSQNSSFTRCDFDEGPACTVMGESCTARGGSPKYGDYNGNACTAGRLFAVWASATPAQVGPAFGLINTFFSAILVSGPQIQVPGNVTFPDTCVGSTSTTTLNVCNTGKADLNVNSITSNNTQFAVTTPSSGFPVTISPDFCFPFQVKFTPTSTGAKTATLTINSDDPANPAVNVLASGNATQQKIATTIADNGDFGDVCVGSFKDLDLTISNTGGCDLSISSITSSSTQFKTAATMSFPLIVQGGTSVHVPIRFQPTSLGVKTGNITISSNDPVNPSKVVAVSGNAPPGDIRVTGSTDFGGVCAGAVAEKTISVCNVGACDLHVTGATLSCADFTLVNNPFPATISHDSCLNLVIRFTPTSPGPKSCTLTITSDDPDTPVINLTVTASTPAAAIDVPPDQSFLPEVIQDEGSCRELQPFPISNTGTCNLIITNITIGGINAADFALSGLPSFPIILEPGHTVGDGDLMTVFAPTEIDRDRLGTLTVTYVSNPISGATTTVTSDLCGEGVRTGARVLVTHAGVPVPFVEKIQIQRINGNRNKEIVDTVDNAMNLPLVTVTPTGPCVPFQYHREYGTVSNPIQLLPGSYQVTATAIIDGKRQHLTVAFDVDTCDFNPTVIVDFP